MPFSIFLSEIRWNHFTDFCSFFFIKFWKQSRPCSYGEFALPSGERIVNCHFCFDRYSIKMQQLNLHQLRKWIICFLSLLNLVLVFCWIGSLVPFQNRTWVVQPPPDEQRQCRLPGQIEVLSWSARFSWKQFPWLKISQTSGTKVLHPCLIDAGRQGRCMWGTLNMMWII